MAIVISGVNNNDKITASDGTIDLLSGVSYAGIITAPAITTPGNITANSLNVGSGIQLGNAGVATATTFVGNLTGNVNATSNLLLQIGGSEKFRVGSSGQLGIGGANYGTSGQVLTSGGSGSAATWSTLSTDLVSDSSPQLGGLLDGNGQTANFTANNTGLGIPIGTDANEPSAGSYKGYIRFNDDDDIIYYSDGTNWKKISSVNAVLSSISGSIYAGTTTNLTLTGTGFLSASLVVNFVQSSDGINTNVTVTPSNDTSATVAVPAAVYNNVTAGNAVTILSLIHI